MMIRGLVVLLLCTATVAWHGDEAETTTPLLLSDSNFEHDTQAATGQTTGMWLVLFSVPGCPKCGEAEEAITKISSTSTPIIIAKVDVSRSPKTGRRFSVDENEPQLKLFRDRHVISYDGDWNSESISYFYKEGWKSATAEDVPEESGYSEEVMKLYRAVLQFLGKNPVVLGVVGCGVALLGYKITIGLLKTKSKRRRGKGRGRAAAAAARKSD